MFGGMAVTVTVTVAEAEVVAAEVVWAVAVVTKVDVGSDGNGVAMVEMVFFLLSLRNVLRLGYNFFPAQRF